MHSTTVWGKYIMLGNLHFERSSLQLTELGMEIVYKSLNVVMAVWNHSKIHLVGINCLKKVTNLHHLRLVMHIYVSSSLNL